MIYYDRIDTSEGLDVSKRSASKECDVCHYWYVLNLFFSSQNGACYKKVMCHTIKGF